MKTIATALLIATLAGCGPTEEERRAAEEDQIRKDAREVIDQCEKSLQAWFSDHETLSEALEKTDSLGNRSHKITKAPKLDLTNYDVKKTDSLVAPYKANAEWSLAFQYRSRNRDGSPFDSSSTWRPIRVELKYEKGKWHGSSLIASSAVLSALKASPPKGWPIGIIDN